MGARLSWRGYASIMHLTRGKALTAAQVAQALGVGVPTMRLVLRRMADLKLLYCADWSPAAMHVVRRPMYRQGSASHAPVPLTSRGNQSRHQAAMLTKLTPRIDMIAFASIVRALKSSPHTRQELAIIAGVGEDSICKLMLHMHGLRMVYVAGFRFSASGPPAECLAFGDRPDAQRPTTQRRPATKRAPMANSSVFNVAREQSQQP